MNVAVVAGEASGDRQAANLLQALANQLPEGEPIVAWGIGGPHLATAGCEIIADSRTWGTIGIVNSLSQPAILLIAMHRFKALLKVRKPDLLILVDFGAFNIPLATWFKGYMHHLVKNGQTRSEPLHSKMPTTIFYYFPPSSWRRKIRLEKLKKLTSVSDLIVTPFSWSEDLLRQAGGNAYFLGHPLLDTVRPTMPIADFDKRYGLDASRTVITLLPGSREHEVRFILPVLLSAAGEIANRLPGVQFLLAKSPNLPLDLFENILRKTQDQGTSASVIHLVRQAGDLIKQASSVLKPPMGELVPGLATPEGLVVKQPEGDHQAPDWAGKRMMKPHQTASLAIVDNATHDAIGRADLVIATSGTATLEAAILGKPQIIVYRGSAMMNLEYKIRQKALNITYIGLPNILADSLVCPELLQEQVTPQNISNEALEMLLQPERLLQAKAKMSEMVTKNLGGAGATQRTASLLLNYMKEKTQVAVDLAAGPHE
jgi:lipid-A-disaccharide synthase